MSKSAKERVVEIVIEMLGVEEAEVTDNVDFRKDLGADSLDLMELIMAMEEEFDGEISDADAQTILTVGHAVAFIEANLIN